MKNRFFPNMSRAWPRFVIVSISMAVLVSAYKATAQGVAPPPNRLAVLDVKYILENHIRFKQAMEELKDRFSKAGEGLKAERIRIGEMEMKLRELKPATPDYNDLDEQINRAKAEWTLNANKQKKEIRKSESQILWNVYYEVKTETKRYCEQNGIGLVIQFNGEPIDSKQPQDVVRGVSRPIVFNDPQMDITPHVLASLNKPVGGQQPAGPVGGRQQVSPR
ncbi:MAG: OmpH family outer membrane protein [Pirellulales bacterium]|nr:OmpH family outer membrane protein [Pirellulales bacterium]